VVRPLWHPQVQLLPHASRAAGPCLALSVDQGQEAALLCKGCHWQLRGALCNRWDDWPQLHWLDPLPPVGFLCCHWPGSLTAPPMVWSCGNACSSKLVSTPKVGLAQSGPGRSSFPENVGLSTGHRVGTACSCGCLSTGMDRGTVQTLLLPSPRPSGAAALPRTVR